jgi:hypothetical protein
MAPQRSFLPVSRTQIKLLPATLLYINTSLVDAHFDIEQSHLSHAENIKSRTEEGVVVGNECAPRRGNQLDVHLRVLLPSTIFQQIR